jgi:aminopeptidase N
VIRYFEGYAHMHPEADTRDLDFAFAVMAHEVAHQWWGHRLIPAGAEGAPLLSESLAWYTALGVVEDAYGEAHLERLLGLLREAYREARPPDRPPLLRSVDEFAAYRQGPLSMYALREYVGSERIDEALRRLLAEYDAAEPPLPTSLALYDELRALTPDSLRPLLSDLLEHNTRWNLAITDARADAMADGTWELTLDLRAGKERVDSAGVATERPLAEPVEIGVYAEGHDGRRGERLHLAMHPVRSGEQTITIRVDERPESVRLDPRYLLVGSNRSRARSVITRADSAVVGARGQARARPPGVGADPVGAP